METQKIPGRTPARRLSLVTLAVASALGLSLAVFTPGSGAQDAVAASSMAPIVGGVVAGALAGNPNLISDVAEKALPSVVSVTNKRFVSVQEREGDFFGSPFFRRHFGGGQPGLPNLDDEDEGQQEERRKEAEEEGQRATPRGSGSGVIVDKDGTIITNYHVVRGADELEITLSDGRSFQAKVKGSDRASDIAVLRIVDPPKNLSAMPWGDSQKLRLGEVVLAIGNPFQLNGTVTMGIVSAKGRADVKINDYNDFIQTDAAINPGNSGGALVDLNGRLVGINSAIFSRSGGYQGIGFAIPAHMARPIMQDLLDDGRVARGWLGVQLQPMSEEVAEAFHANANEGVLVADVIDDSPAAKAGLTRGDVIVSIDGETVRGPGELRNLVAGRGAGRPVELAVLRDGKPKKMQAVLGDLSAAEKVTATAAELGGVGGLLKGLTVGPLDEGGRRLARVPETLREGVVVGVIEEGSPAADAGLLRGDVIVELDRQPVRNVEEFRRLYKEDTKQLLLLIRRQQGTLYLVLRK